MSDVKLIKFGHVPPFCGFCGCNSDGAAMMLGPKPFICDGCVATCVSILVRKLGPHTPTMRQILKSVGEVKSEN